GDRRPPFAWPRSTYTTASTATPPGSRGARALGGEGRAQRASTDRGGQPSLFPSLGPGGGALSPQKKSLEDRRRHRDEPLADAHVPVLVGDLHRHLQHTAEQVVDVVRGVELEAQAVELAVASLVLIEREDHLERADVEVDVVEMAGHLRDRSGLVQVLHPDRDPDVVA